MTEWPFDQGKNVACLTTVQVLQQGFPVLQVRHYEDDHSWAFTCGTSNLSEDARVVGMGEILSRDPSLRTVADLPPGWSAWRENCTADWNRYETPPDPDEEA